MVEALLAKTYRLGSVDSFLLREFQNEQARLHHLEPITWAGVGTTRQGRMAVVGNSNSWETAHVGITLLAHRRGRIRMQLVVNNLPFFRVDINDTHNGWGIQTHSHRLEASTGREIACKVDDFDYVQDDPSVPTGTEERCLRDFSRMIRLELQDDFWKEPRW